MNPEDIFPSKTEAAGLPLSEGQEVPSYTHSPVPTLDDIDRMLQERLAGAEAELEEAVSVRDQARQDITRLNGELDELRKRINATKPRNRRKSA